MATFSRRKTQGNLSPRQAWTNKYTTARNHLLLVLAFTVVNLALLLFGGDTYFLFSASIPYYLVLLGKILCGKFPPAFYLENYETTRLDFRPDSFLFAMIGIAVVILVLYLLCWLFSKKRVGWLIAAAVLFVADIVGLFLFLGVSSDSFLDLFFHVWVMYYLILGIVAHEKLKTLPPDPLPVAPSDAETTAE